MAQYGRHSSGRIVISRLYEGYPAYRCEGLQVGDVLSTINGETVESTDDAYRCPPPRPLRPLAATRHPPLLTITRLCACRTLYPPFTAHHPLPTSQHALPA